MKQLGPQPNECLNAEGWTPERQVHILLSLPLFYSSCFLFFSQIENPETYLLLQVGIAY